MSDYWWDTPDNCKTYRNTSWQCCHDSWYCGAGVFGLMGCIPPSLSLALPTFFNNNNDNNNILGYPSKYWNYTSKMKFGCFPHSSRPPPQWISFLPFISQKILLSIKDVKFDFRMGCILVLFPFLWIINVQPMVELVKWQTTESQVQIPGLYSNF